MPGTPTNARAEPTGIEAEPEQQPQAAAAELEDDLADLEERESLVHSEKLMRVASAAEPHLQRRKRPLPPLPAAMGRAVDLDVDVSRKTVDGAAQKAAGAA